MIIDPQKELRTVFIIEAFNGFYAKSDAVLMRCDAMLCSAVLRRREEKRRARALEDEDESSRRDAH